MEAAEKQESNSSFDEQIIVFGLHNELFGFNISLINEITEVSSLSMVPKAPDFITGVINYHGEVVAVMSLARFFNLPSHERGSLSRIIVLAAPGYSIGLLVDNVREITFVPHSAEEKNPMEGEDFKNIYVDMVLSLGNSLVNMINIKKLLSDLEDYFKEADIGH